MIMIDLVTNENFATVDELIWCAIHAVNEIENEELESVKLFGNSHLMMDILKKLFTDPQYNFIKIGSINVTAVWFDKNEKDDYVLELNDNYELSIQSAWNNGIIFKHEAKYAILLVSIISDDIIVSVIEEDIPFLVANFT